MSTDPLTAPDSTSQRSTTSTATRRPLPPGGRRMLFTRAGAAAAGAALATALHSRSAVADNGDPLLIGTANTGLSATNLTGSLFRVEGTHSGSQPLAGVNLASSSSSVGVLGMANGGAGVKGVNVAGALGGVIDGTGVQGQGDVCGVDGYSLAGVGVLGRAQMGTGVEAISGNQNDLRCSGTGRIWLKPQFSPGAPASGNHLAGEIVCDGEGSFFVCVTGGNPGTWRRIGSAGSSGQFHAVDPFRAYDSRRPAYPINGPLATGASRVVSIADSHDPTTGSVLIANLVPSGATAVAYNLTAVAPTGATGNLAVMPGSATTALVASLNWSAAGQAIANASVVKLDTNRQIKVFAAGAAGSVQFVVDVVGYYR